MSPGRNDDPNRLYRDDEPEQERPQAPSTGRRRVSFGETTPAPRAPKVTPVPAPRPTPQPQSATSSSARPQPPPRRPSGGRSRRSRQRRRRPVRNFLRVVLLLLVAWVVFVIATPIYAWSNLTHVDAMPTGERPPTQPGQLWLLVGSDSREGLSAEERETLGTGDTEGRRTDTVLLLYAPPWGGDPALISIPRDSYVDIPGYQRNKINAAYAFGGAPLLIETVELNTGLRVDHYTEMGFGGFVNVIDALGGIEMCPANAINDKFSRLDIPAGCQEMDGVTALGYVRMRYADPRGDLGRMERQREMIAGMVDKAASPAKVLNPVRWWQLNTAAASALQVDEDTGLFTLAGLARPMAKLGSGDGYEVMVPVSSPNTSTSVGSVMIWDQERAEAMFAAIRSGSTANFEQYAG